MIKLAVLPPSSITSEHLKRRPEILKTNRIKHRSATKVYVFSNQSVSQI